MSTRSGFYFVLAFFVCGLGFSCQQEQKIASSESSLPPLLNEKDFSQPDSEVEIFPLAEPVELAGLQPASTTLTPITAPAVIIIEQAAPVTYTWKEIEPSANLPKNIPSEPVLPNDAEENWKPTQPVIIFPDNIPGRATQKLYEQPPRAEPPVAVDQKNIKTLNKEQLALFDNLQGKILKLLLALRNAEEQNIRMQRSLIENREAYSQIRNDLNRKMILIEMHKIEINELHEKLAKVSPGGIPATQPGENEMDLVQLRRRNKRLKLQLKLAGMQGPDKVRQLSTKLAEMFDKFSDMEDIHTTLSRLVVAQADQIKALQKERRAMQTTAMRKFAAKKTGYDISVKTSSQKPITEKTLKVITGTIKTIDGSVVIINIGSKKGLEKNMRMIVYRDDKFIGYLRLYEIGQDESVGKLVRKIIAPKIGDKVVDKLE